MKEKILKLKEQGLSYNEIKKQLGCSKGIISYYCRSGRLPEVAIKICKNCKKEFKNKEFVNGERKSMHSRRYCLECSPWGENNNIQLEKVIHDGKFGCYECKERKEKSEFYYYKSGKRHAYCKECNRDRVLNTQKKFKIKCVEYKGGKCEKCGYNNFMEALDFHHIDPKMKEFRISKAKMLSDFSVAQKELDKCQLLCANCHREEHAKLDKETRDLRKKEVRASN